MKASMSLQHFVGQVKQLLLGLPGAHFLTLSYMCNLHMNITMNLALLKQLIPFVYGEGDF
jgi:hypothetical protein